MCKHCVHISIIYAYHISMLYFQVKIFHLEVQHTIHILTYLDGSSWFMSFMWSGMMDVELLWRLYRPGNWPLKSD